VLRVNIHRGTGACAEGCNAWNTGVVLSDHIKGRIEVSSLHEKECMLLCEQL